MKSTHLKTLRELLATLVVFGILPRASKAVVYEPIDLGALGAYTSAASDVSENGYVTGKSRVDYTTDHAFLWHGGTMIDLTPGISTDCEGRRVNCMGHVTGNVGNGEYAFLYRNGGLIDLGTLGQRIWAEDLNDADQVVGRSRRADGITRAFMWDNGTITDLGSFTDTSESYATGINNQGQITGYADTIAAPYILQLHAFIWQDKVFTDLGTLEPSNHGDSYAAAINELGQVVGRSEYGAGDYRHAFLWDATYGMTDLGTFGGIGSLATDVNNMGQVVGSSQDGSGLWQPFLWQDGVMTDLNELLDPGSGWEITYAYGINDQGWIAGYGKNPDGKGRAVLLVPEPGSILLVLSGTAVLRHRRRSRQVGL